LNSLSIISNAPQVQIDAQAGNCRTSLIEGKEETQAAEPHAYYTPKKGRRFQNEGCGNNIDQME